MWVETKCSHNWLRAGDKYRLWLVLSDRSHRMGYTFSLLPILSLLIISALSYDCCDRFSNVIHFAYTDYYDILHFSPDRLSCQLFWTVDNITSVFTFCQKRLGRQKIFSKNLLIGDYQTLPWQIMIQIYWQHVNGARDYIVKRRSG